MSLDLPKLPESESDRHLGIQTAMGHPMGLPGEEVDFTQGLWRRV